MAEVYLRGILAASTIVSVNLGIFLSYCFGMSLSWRVLSWIATGLSALFLGLSFLLPETPSFLLARGKKEEARASFKKFRGQYFDPWVIDEEISNICEIQKKYKRQSSFSWTLCKERMIHVYKTREIWRPLLILVGLMFICEFSGSSVIIAYAAFIFQEYGHIVDELLATLMAGLALFLLSTLGCILVHFVPRRTLLLISGSGMSVSMFLTALSISINGFHSWFTIIGIWIYLMFVTPGFLMVPCIYVSELFPIHVRGMTSSIIFALKYLFIFIALCSAPSLLGTKASIWIFACVSIIGTVFVYYFAPETKGKQLWQIEEEIQLGIPATQTTAEGTLKEDSPPKEFVSKMGQSVFYVDDTSDSETSV